ncbi:hypothetical protein TOT_020000107 [Theileria orientalis strain Shintoku]|uniref:Uncharacterized protein n=1 Tax=Theileria orientalis strain Shintoku TaxID=869250 RepID=J4C352_THEOR|nr:hypothetical protein TOT_020000107 [Theileria orientalis strain Shintoku]PVC50205.1 hypothetical protein MACL_00002455 [Theileria orientalis]BAM39836.1 hypothetical protein TOT_020000107 [Theileria orientalis strain Shintoku]|eukprot:XP_009690137.1 hypothetical protein TOT_020000107 [Theileria orientalis strain Shintoku]
MCRKESRASEPEKIAVYCVLDPFLFSNGIRKSRPSSQNHPDLLSIPESTNGPSTLLSLLTILTITE